MDAFDFSQKPLEWLEDSIKNTKIVVVNSVDFIIYLLDLTLY